MVALDMTHVNQGMLATLCPGIAIYSKEDVLKVCVDRFLADVGVSLIHSHMISVDMFFFNEARMKTEIPYVATLHGSYENSTLSGEQLQRILDGVSFWVYLAEKNLSTLKKGNLDPKKTLKLGNAMPVDPSAFPLTRQDLGITADTVVFTLVARGIKPKGWESAIVAFSKLRKENPDLPMHLLLCGEGEETERLKVVFPDPQDITFLGYQSCITGLYRISDCAILPTRFHGESFPLSLIQAMQVGLPIIATRIGEIENMICRCEKKAGILIQPYEDDDLFNYELFASMREMLDKTTRKEFSKISTEFGKLYDMGDLTNRYYQLYEFVIEGHCPTHDVQGDECVLMTENSGVAPNFWQPSPTVRERWIVGMPEVSNRSAAQNATCSESGPI